jgi:hypothetical protein
VNKIERFLFDDPAEENRFYLFAGFRHDGDAIALRIDAGSNQPGVRTRVMRAIFEEAQVTRIDGVDARHGVWPLEIVGFDSERKGERWSFVLHCEAGVWAWISKWPIVLEMNGEVSEVC